jgi:hypothetical protein
MNRKYHLFFLLSASLLLGVLSGCTDVNEMRHQSFITAIGLERLDDNHIELAIQELPFDRPQQDGDEEGSQGGKSGNTKVIVASCAFFPECINLLHSKLSGRLTFNKVEYILLGEKLLKSGVAPYIDYFYQMAEMDETVRMFATNQDVREFLKNDKGMFLHRFIEGVNFRPNYIDVKMWEFSPKIYTTLHSAVLSSIAIRNDELSNGIFMLHEDRLRVRLSAEDELLVQMLLKKKINEITLTFEPVAKYY